MPSSLTMVISRTLVFSTHPPVLVYGTVILSTPHEDFLGSVVRPLRRYRYPPLICFRIDDLTDLPIKSIYGIEPVQPMTGWFTFLRPSLSDDALNIVPEY